MGFICILQSGPRPRGNTAKLVKPFEAKLQARGAGVERIVLASFQTEAAVQGVRRVMDALA